MTRGTIGGKIKVAAVLIIVMGVGIQFLPYGRQHTNPPVQQEPPWDQPGTRHLAQRACFDCHSNQTKWPWYASVAPVSWVIQHHVDKGRRELNLSEWNLPQKEAKDAVKVILNGKMPLPSYLRAHPEARLQAAEKQRLIDGLNATFHGRTSTGR